MATEKKYLDFTGLGQYDKKIKAVISAGDQSAKDYADSQIEAAGKLYDAAGAAATVQDNLNTEIARAQAAEQANATAIAKLNGDATTDGSVAKAVADSAATLQASINAVDDKADQNATDIDALEGKVAALEAGTYDDTEVRGLISDNADAIDALEKTHATDKSALEAAIALKADQTALDAVSAVANAAVKQTDYNTKVAALEAKDTELATAISDEAARAAGVESGLKNRIETMEAFWTAAQADGTDSNVIDTLKEIQDYIASDKTGASEMLAAIEANEQAISEMDAAYKAADVTLQGNIDKKADTSVVEALDGRVEELETASDTYALKTEVKAVSDSLTEYKNAHASDYTNAQIDAAIKVNADTYATDAEVTAAIKAEVARANDAYAAKALEATVDSHVADKVVHITADERTLWNAALQAADIVTGSANGAISVKGTDVAVKGLGSAAFTESSAYDASGAAAAVQTKLDAEVTRAKAAEQANADAIASFVAIGESEINQLFA